MTGWKTKAGAWCIFAAGIFEAAARSVPTEEWKPWLSCVATILVAAGGGLGVAGIAHKIEKASQ